MNKYLTALFFPLGTASSALIVAAVLAVSSAADAQTVVIDAYGESTTSGWPAPWTTQDNPPSQLQAALGSGVQVRNLGAPSTLTSDMLRGITLSDMSRSGLSWCPAEVCVGHSMPFSSAVAASRSSIVIINRGINEADRGLSLLDQLNKAVYQARQAGKLVVLQTPNPVQTGYAGTVSQYASQIRSLAYSYGLPVADGFNAFNYSYIGDGIHPSPSGYQSMTNNLAATINNVNLIQTARSRREITKLYVSLFVRAPDSGGLVWWANTLNGGRAIQDIAQDMYNATEARAKYPAGMSNRDYIVALYRNALARPDPLTTDAAGVAYWESQLSSKTRGAVLCDILNIVDNYSSNPSADPQENAKALASQRVLTHRVNAGMYFGAILSSDCVADAYSLMASVNDQPTSVTAATSQFTVARNYSCSPK